MIVNADMKHMLLLPVLVVLPMAVDAAISVGRYARFHSSYTPSELKRRGWRRMELNPQRYKCSEREVSEISGFYDKLIWFYSEAKCADMVDLMGSVPVAVNTADESVMKEVNGRLAAMLKKDFGARNKVLDFDDEKAFDEYCKLNLAVVRFLFVVLVGTVDGFVELSSDFGFRTCISCHCSITNLK